VAFKILSIDGGGIRGIIPAAIIAEIERITGQPASSLFDLIAGTSTGGIIALGLARPNADGMPRYSAQDLVELYDSEGSKIFSRSLKHKALSIGSLANAKYTSVGLDETLLEFFEDTMLSEALTGLVIPSYEIEKRLPIYFTSNFAIHRDGFNHRMNDVARSTSSAPTYFKPYRLKTESRVGRLSVIDGGVFANNPTLAAFAEATGTYKARIDDTVIVSLGTGKGAQPIPLSRALKWGLVGWSTRILDVVMDSVSESVHHQTRYLLRGTQSQQQYCRLQPILEKAERRLDNATRENIKNLRRVAKEFIQENQPKIAEICELLSD